MKNIYLNNNYRSKKYMLKYRSRSENIAQDRIQFLKQTVVQLNREYASFEALSLGDLYVNSEAWIRSNKTSLYIILPTCQQTYIIPE